MGENGGKINVEVLRYQQSEVDGAALYHAIARGIRDEKNKNILTKIASDETRHARMIEAHTGVALKPNRLRLFFLSLLTRLMGYTFSIKLLERNEKTAGTEIALASQIPGFEEIVRDEESHESQLVDMLEEERVGYIGSIVLGMNDALVELTGALAGYTLAMRDTRIISMAGLITGFSATLSMAASGYLSARADGRRDALKSSVYTGVAYLLTVALLILPYLLFPEDAYLAALGVTMAAAIGIIAVFNGYVAVVLDRSFKKGFLEMSVLSIGVAVISFVIGIVVKRVLGIDL